jgi:hypothetical protein
VTNETALPTNVGSNDQLGPNAEGVARVLRELDDTTNQTWRGKRARWAALVREQAAEIAELDALRDRLAELLRQTAVALRGPEPPLTRWSWHDLPAEAEKDLIEIKRLRAVVNAAQEWSGDRAVRDWGDADLMKALWTFKGGNTEPCPEFDGECGEPCAPCTVANAHAAIDAAIDGLVKRGKLYRG